MAKTNTEQLFKAVNTIFLSSGAKINSGRIFKLSDYKGEDVKQLSRMFQAKTSVVEMDAVQVTQETPAEKAMREATEEADAPEAGTPDDFPDAPPVSTIVRPGQDGYDETNHQVIQEDLNENPEWVAQGIKVGDSVDLTEEEEDSVSPSVTKIPGVGKATAEKLAAIGIQSIEDLLNGLEDENTKEALGKSMESVQTYIANLSQ